MSRIDLAGQADVTFVGVGTVDENAALLRDGFVRADEVRALAPFLLEAGFVRSGPGFRYAGPPETDPLGQGDDED